MEDTLNCLATSIEDYISNGGDFKEISYIIETYTGKDWINYIDNHPHGLNKNRVYLSSNIEILILSWKSNYKTLPHDHSKNGCWLKVLKGTLSEKLYNHNFNLTCKSIIYQGDISFMSNDIGYHSIANETENTTFSIHIYSPPLHKTKYYNID